MSEFTWLAYTVMRMQPLEVVVLCVRYCMVLYSIFVLSTGCPEASVKVAVM